MKIYRDRPITLLPPQKGVDPMKDRIKELRKILGLSQAEFANALDLNASTVSVWERDGKISQTNLSTICKVYGVNRSWLEKGQDPIFSTDKEIPTSEGIDDRLRAIRKKFGLTQKELAARLGVSEMTVFFWEKNKRIPSPKQALICETLGINLDWLKTGSGEMLPTKPGGEKPESPREFALRNGCDEISATLFERFMGLSEAEKKAFSRTLLQIVSGKDLVAAGQQIQIEEGSGSASNTGGIVLKGLIKTRDITVNNYKDPDEK